MIGSNRISPLDRIGTLRTVEETRRADPDIIDAGPQDHRLPAIDALRGIAVLAVLVSHLPFQIGLNPLARGIDPMPATIEHVTRYGATGVHLFLVLSGFCIHLRWARQRENSAPDFAAFWRRRLYRLYPPYFAALVFTLLGLIVLYGGVLHYRASLPAWMGYTSGRQLTIDLVVLVLLLQNTTGAAVRIGNAPFWTLALEEQLYALYAPMLWLRRWAGWGWTLVVVALVTIVWRMAIDVPGVQLGALARGCWLYVGPARWLEWTLGALAAEAYVGRITLPTWMTAPSAALAISVAAIAASWSAFPIPTVWSDLWFGCAYFAWLNVVVRRAWTPPILPQLGRWSYSLYLISAPTIVAAKYLALSIGGGVWLILIARIALPLMAGYTFFRLVESRFLSRRPMSPNMDGDVRALGMNERPDPTRRFHELRGMRRR